MGRLLSADPVRKIQKKWHYSPSDESAVVESIQEVTDLVELNKAERNSFRGVKPRHGEYGDLYARVPMIVVGDLISRGIFYDDERFNAWLDSDEAEPWRRRPGKLGRKRLSVIREELR